MALVLCGGASRRMGTDKALLGPPDDLLAARVVRALRGAGCDPVLLVGGDVDGLRGVGDAHLVDPRPGAGPLVATAAALSDVRVPAGAVVVSSCDLPWLGPGTVGELLGAVGGGAPAAVAVVDGRDQWSVVALGPVGRAGVAAAVAAGGRSWRAALGGAAVRIEPARPGELRDVDEPAQLPHWLRGAAVPPDGPGAQ